MTGHTTGCLSSKSWPYLPGIVHALKIAHTMLARFCYWTASALSPLVNKVMYVTSFVTPSPEVQTQQNLM